MTKEFSAFMDGPDCHECQCYEREEKRLRERIAELDRVVSQFIYFMEQQESGHYFSKSGNIYLDFKKTLEAK